jgi:hypothetical protein
LFSFAEKPVSKLTLCWTTGARRFWPEGRRRIQDTPGSAPTPLPTPTPTKYRYTDGSGDPIWFSEHSTGRLTAQGQTTWRRYLPLRSTSKRQRPRAPRASAKRSSQPIGRTPPGQARHRRRKSSAPPLPEYCGISGKTRRPCPRARTVCYGAFPDPVPKTPISDLVEALKDLKSAGDGRQACRGSDPHPRQTR